MVRLLVARPVEPVVLDLRLVAALDAPILMSGLASGSCSFCGGGGAGVGAGGGGSGGGNGGGLGVSTLGDPPPPIHMIYSPFVE